LFSSVRLALDVSLTPSDGNIRPTERALKSSGAEKRTMHPTLRCLLLGTNDEGSPLHRLAGLSDVIEYIWSLATMTVPNLASATLLSHFSADQHITTCADGAVSEWGNMVRGGPSLRPPRSNPTQFGGPPPEWPRVSTHACNGLPALLFYGDAQLSGKGFKLGDGGRGSVLMVIKQTNDFERNKVPWQLGGYYVHSPYSDNGHQDQSFVCWRGDNRGPSGVRYHHWHVLLWIEDGDKTELWNNGSLAQTYQGGKQPAWAKEETLTINPNHGGHGIEGEVAEFCMFDAALNAADRRTLLAHISMKYQIGAK
jgi:hypothetical protein